MKFRRKHKLTNRLTKRYPVTTCEMKSIIIRGISEYVYAVYGLSVSDSKMYNQIADEAIEWLLS